MNRPRTNRVYGWWPEIIGALGGLAIITSVFLLAVGTYR